MILSRKKIFFLIYVFFPIFWNRRNMIYQAETYSRFSAFPTNFSHLRAPPTGVLPIGVLNMNICVFIYYILCIYYICVCSCGIH